MNHCVKKNRMAFTLLELLVVMGIIITLAALLYPVLNTTADKSKMSRCLGNLKNLHQIVMVYTSEAFPSDIYKSYLPSSLSDGFLKKWGGVSLDSLKCPYAKSGTIGYKINENLLSNWSDWNTVENLYTANILIYEVETDVPSSSAGTKAFRHNGLCNAVTVYGDLQSLSASEISKLNYDDGK